MPGFLLHAHNEEAIDGNVSFPHNLAYTYTWDISEICQRSINQRNDTFIYLRDCTLPDFSVDVEEYQAPSIKYKYAKGISWADVKLSFYDTMGLLPLLQDLKARIWTPTAGLQPALSYKYSTRIRVYTADDNTVSQNWELKGSWMKGLSWSPLSYATSDAHIVNVTLAYDWAELNSSSDGQRKHEQAVTQGVEDGVRASMANR